MRFSPLTLAVAVAAFTVSTAGAGQGTRATDPASLAWTQRGDAALTAGQAEEATDAYETAAALDPVNGRAFTGLAAASLALELPGKAIRFYREALQLNGRDRTALAGIGEAFAVKGANTQAEATLTQLREVCGGGACPELAQVQAALDRGTVSTADITAAVEPVAADEQAN